MRILRPTFVLVSIFVVMSGLLLVGDRAFADWGKLGPALGYFDGFAGGSCTTTVSGPIGPGPYPPDGSKICAAGVLPSSGGGDAIDQSVILNAQKSGGDVVAANTLITILRTDYNKGGWSATGAAYIVDSMLGMGPKSSRSISNAEWFDLQQRLDAAASKGYIDFNAKINVQGAPYNGVDTYYQRYRDDIAWYSDTSSPTTIGITIQDGKNIVYALWYICANPLGNLPGVPKPPQWSITPSTTASKTNSVAVPGLASNEVIPGDTITWTHTVKNNGPDSTDQNVDWRYNHYTDGTRTSTGGNWTLPSGTPSGKSVSKPSTFKPTNGDLGTQVCRTTWAQPHAWNNPGSIESARICYNVVYRYNLTPIATFSGGNLNPPSGVEPGTGNLTIEKSVKNTGATASPANTAWVLTKCTYGPGVLPATYTATAGPSGSSAVCVNSQQLEAGSTQFPQNATTHLTPDLTGQSVPLTTPVGSHICYILSVSPSVWNDNRWAHSQPACLAVTKSPKVQAWGGDIRAGTIKTAGVSTVPVNGKYYGSWAEYGMFGFGPIIGMSSNAATAGGASSIPSPQAQAALTFANAPDINSLGNFQPAPLPDTYFTAYKALATQPTPPIPTGLVRNGTHEIIYVPGPLTINADITYSGNYGSASDIPRVIIVVDGDIKIDPSVKRIDAWLIAKGTLYTCDVPHGMSMQNLTISDGCDQQLIFNGPVNVDNAVLARTYGADGANEGQPAEIFNLDPATFLSGYTASVTQSNIQTVYEKELPPRW